MRRGISRRQEARPPDAELGAWKQHQRPRLSERPLQDSAPLDHQPSGWRGGDDSGPGPHGEDDAEAPRGHGNPPVRARPSEAEDIVAQAAKIAWADGTPAAVLLDIRFWRGRSL